MDSSRLSRRGIRPVNLAFHRREIRTDLNFSHPFAGGFMHHFNPCVHPMRWALTITTTRTTGADLWSSRLPVLRVQVPLMHLPDDLKDDSVLDARRHLS